jgi:hypothetical protein
MENFYLEKVNTLRLAIEQAGTVQEIKGALDAAATVQTYIRQTKQGGNDASLQVFEYIIRAERKLGEILQAAKAAGQITHDHGNRYKKVVPEENNLQFTLEQAGINRKLSSRAQLIADVPLDEFERLIATGRAARKLSRNLFTKKELPSSPPRQVKLENNGAAGPKVTQPDITPDMLSKTAREKFDIIIKKYKQLLAGQFEQIVRARIDELLDSTIGPGLRRDREDARRILERHKGIMTRKDFNRIRACLHGDRTPTAEEKHNAFVLLTSFERVLLPGKEHPVFPGEDIPATAAEWDALKKKAAQVRQARQKSRTTKQTNIIKPQSR